MTLAPLAPLGPLAGRLAEPIAAHDDEPVGVDVARLTPGLGMDFCTECFTDDGEPGGAPRAIVNCTTEAIHLECGHQLAYAPGIDQLWRQMLIEDAAW